VRELAAGQVAAGADVLDVNVGVPGLDDVALMPQVVKIVAETVDVPICLDSPNPAALAAALAVVPGKPLVNSVNGEEASLKAMLPLVKDRGAAVIGLTMDETGIPHDPEGRQLHDHRSGQTGCDDPRHRSVARARCVCSALYQVLPRASQREQLIVVAPDPQIVFLCPLTCAPSFRHCSSHACGRRRGSSSS
jgi:hypothetical protein